MMSIGCLIALFAGLFILPASWFWFWFIPLSALFIRFNWVILKRERERSVGHQGRPAASGDRG